MHWILIGLLDLCCDPKKSGLSSPIDVCALKNIQSASCDSNNSCKRESVSVELIILESPLPYMKHEANLLLGNNPLHFIILLVLYSEENEMLFVFQTLSSILKISFQVLLGKSKSEEEEDKAFFALHRSVSTGNQHAEKIPACHEKPRCVSSCFRHSMQATLVLEKKHLYFPFPLASVLFTSQATRSTLHEKQLHEQLK